MKINKLFHWLYGALMCLPLLGVLFTSLYVTFNPNAKDSYSGSYLREEYSVDYEFQTNAIVTRDDLIEGNIYKYVFNTNDVPDGMVTKLIESNYIKINGNSFFIDFESSSYLLTLRKNVNNTYYLYADGFVISQNIIYNGDNVIYFTYDSDTISSLGTISESDFLGNESVVINEIPSQDLDNVFTYAINDINNNALYNWAQDSFLVTPIAFVTGLFGLTQTSPVVTLLSYWLTISIVWLVFDLIMYIPLLVHRWLDKGVLS